MKKSLMIFTAMFLFALVIRFLFPLPSDSGVKFLPIVKGCAESDNGMSSRSIDFESSPELRVNGKDLIYTHALSHLCCRKATLSYSIIDNDIYINELWTGPGCKCRCYSSLTAKLSHLPEGEYNINVYEKGTNPLTGEELYPVLLETKKVYIP